MRRNDNLFSRGLFRSAVVIGLLAFSGNAFAQAPGEETTKAKAEAQPQSMLLLETTTHGDGVPIVYPTGTPQITMRVTEVPPGVSTPKHRHTIPLAVYILKGELTLHGENGSLRRFKEGEAFMESTDWHFGRNEGTELVRLLAVYPGVVGAPLSIRPAP